MKPSPTSSRMTAIKNEQVNVWRKTIELFKVGQRVHTKSNDIAAILGIEGSYIRRASLIWRELGMLTIEKEWAARDGQRVFWTFHVDAVTGEELINDYFARGGTLGQLQGKSGRKSPRVTAPVATAKAPAPAVTAPVATPKEPARQNEKPMPPEIAAAEKVALAVRPEEETRAVAGPEAPNPFEAIRHLRKDDGEALLAAARQYAGRQEAIFSSFDNLEKLGVRIDRAMAMKAVSFEHDPILEAVTSLLPIFDRLTSVERQVTEWRTEVASLRSENRTMRNELQREKDANRRLSERNAALIAGKGNSHASLGA